jgi:pimeloyl-ACP methyl ester carboxylesterase
VGRAGANSRKRGEGVTVLSDDVESRFIVVDGIRTHYLEAGKGFTVVLLHSGEYGASAELSWEYNLDALAAHFRVIAPDWLGFGQTDKIYDFAGGSRRRVTHMRRVIEALDISSAFFVGSSFGASTLARDAASSTPSFPAEALVLSAGGGFVPNNQARNDIVDYDCTEEGMRRIIKVLFSSEAWAADDDYVRRRHASSLVPGAWEVTAASRFKSPVSRGRTNIGQPDRTQYEQITCPTLVIAGGEDKLREPGYADEVAARIPNSQLHVYEGCGHLPHIERAQQFNEHAVQFLKECLEARASRDSNETATVPRA